MPVIIAWLGQALSWIAGNFLIKWAAFKLLIVGFLVIVLPWVLKDTLIWFWSVSSSYRSLVFEFVNQQIVDVIGQAGINASLSITSIGGYIANQIGLLNYFSILVTGFTICWSIRFIGKFL